MGIINRKITTTPPKRVPTNISGLPSEIALKLTAVSGIEVNKPSTKNEIAKVDNFNLRAMVSIDFIINPAPNQIATNDIK